MDLLSTLITLYLFSGLFFALCTRWASFSKMALWEWIIIVFGWPLILLWLLLTEWKF